MTAQVITKYKSMFEETTEENQERDYVEAIDFMDMDIKELQQLKTIYEDFGFLGEALDVIKARIKELTE